MRLINRFILLLLGIAGAFMSVQAQTTNGLVGYYSFDACDATDDTGISPPGVISGSPACGCGASGNALYFDGVNDFIEFVSGSQLLAQDFTASFFMAPENDFGVVDIFSRRELCTADSAVTIRLEPATRLVRAELAEGNTERATSMARLPNDRCWVHVAWVRAGQDLRLYFDGVLVDESDIPAGLDARNNGILSLANSPCLANGEQRFKGAIDEFRVYNRALSSAEIAGLFIPIDVIQSRDTVLFRGSSVQVSLPISCATTFSWSPSSTVTQPGDQEPVLTPDESTTYEVTMDYGFCRAMDTILVIVVDSSEVDCETIFLPNAFTPNGDGLNDEFGLTNDNFFLGDFISLDIYDRWGSHVFQGETTTDKWDGLIQGAEAMPGRYVYKLRYRCEGEQRMRAGSVILIK